MPQNTAQVIGGHNWLNITLGGILGILSAYLGALWAQAGPPSWCYPKGIIFCYHLGRTNLLIPLGVVFIFLLLLSRVNRIKESVLSILFTTLIFFFIGLAAYTVYFFFIAPFFYT